MNEQPETRRGRGGRGRVAIALAVAALATASVLAACTTSVDGTATFEGAGTIVGTDTGSVPTPSDATVTTESSEPSSTTPAAPPSVTPEQLGYCNNAYSLAGGFLPDWDAATAGGADVTPEVRQTVAASINNTINAMYPVILQITDTSVRPLFDQLLATLHALASDVAGGNSANLDSYNDLTSQIKAICSP